MNFILHSSSFIVSSMPKRIAEQYQLGDEVEIILSHIGGKEWIPARVLRHEPPGIWVQAADGREWFMTNVYRIRKAAPSEHNSL
jgi:hypothetical protein